jgi:Mg2+ and Co2+ transporter CorA
MTGLPVFTAALLLVFISDRRNVTARLDKSYHRLHNLHYPLQVSHSRSKHRNTIIGIIGRGGSTDLPTEQFQMDSDTNPEPTANTDERSQAQSFPPAMNMNMDIHNDPSLSSISTSGNAEAAPTFSPQTHFQYYRHKTRSDERAILGRAVLTTPHRRMPAIRITTGPRPPFASSMNPGPNFAATPIFVTKFSLCESLGCALRDLRVIDQFSSNGRYSGPAFLARSNCVIVNVGHVRAIVMRNQILIFLPEVANGVRRSGCYEASSFDEGRGNINGHLDSYGNTHDYDYGHHHDHRHDHVSVSTDGKRKQSNVKMMDTIESLVEALVTHLNSIYHSSHHLIFDEEKDGRDTKLVSKNNLSMGQHWGYSNIGEVHGMDQTPNHKRVKEGKRRLLRKKDTNKNVSRKVSAGTSPGQSAPVPPFELVAIEALLGHVCSFESSKVGQIIQRAKDVLGGITYNFKGREEAGRKKDAFIEMQAKLGELLPLKNKVDELEAQCAEVAGAIAEVLKNDEDMAAMRLSEIHGDGVLQGDIDNLHVEVELLFEDYLLQMDEVLVALRSVQSYVRNTEEVVEIELDLLRNRIMRYEMLLELSGLVVGVAAAVTGAFGMNLVSRLEEHPTMFYNVIGALLVVMAAMGYSILRKLSMDNIL